MLGRGSPWSGAGARTRRRRLLRRETDAAIVMLTAKGEEIDRIVGLELGADDYVTKPFSFRELTARIRTVLGRTRWPAAGPPPSAASELFRSGSLEMDMRAHRAWLSGSELPLKPREFALLALMIENPGRLLNRDQILQQVWGEDYVGDPRTVDVHIRWLREKIEQDPGHPQRIVTIRGIGYRFDG